MGRGEDAKARSNATALDTGSETIVQQQFRDEVDINTIVHRFGITGQMPVGNVEGVYGDFTDVSDYESALARVRKSNDEFLKLPVKVREKFLNDPARLMIAARSMPVEELQAMISEVASPPPVAPPVGGVVAPVPPVVDG